MSKVCLISLGGTITGCSSNPVDTTTYKVPVLTAQQLLDSIPQVPGVLVDADNFMPIESSSLTPDLWQKLSNHVTEKLNMDYDGVVILHGTDTMEETAYYLNLTVNTSKPIVITGAMRPNTALSADGPLNLYQSIQVAASKLCYDLGVVTVMNNLILSARELHKHNSVRTDAFNSIEMGLLGTIIDGYIDILYKSNKLHTSKSCFCNISQELPNVRIIYTYAGAPATLLTNCLIEKVNGVIISAVGNGNISPSWREAIQKLTSAGIKVVRCSRTLGPVNYNGSNNDDLLHTIAGNSLSCDKARILLMLALTKTKNNEEIQNYFYQY
jgi:L-asparaginase